MEEDSHLEYLRDLHERVREWRPWTLTLGEVSDRLGVDPSRGLDRLDAHNRRQFFGPNVPIDLGQGLRFSRVLLEEVTEPMMLLLLAVGALYSLWGDPWDAATIFATIGAVIALGVATEWRAKRSLVSLHNSVPANTTVLRGGHEGIVAADDLVPGDVVMLSHGQTVPADAVVAACHGFSVDESMLTGESLGVRKAALGSRAAQQCSGQEDEMSPPALLYAGTTVSSGRAVCVVVATGAQTQVSTDIYGLVRDTRAPPTPLQKRMQRLAGALSLVGVVLCMAVTGIGVLQGMAWHGALLMGMSLAFATIPEELPLIAKASLALGARQLARHRLLVRRLSAADALASVSVIVADKTGTLTRNKLVVSSILVVGCDDAHGTRLSVEVITPEAVATSEKAATLATPLYAAWSLSVDPLEARPLAHFLAAVQRRLSPTQYAPDRLRGAGSSASSNSSGSSGSGSATASLGGFQPVHGFGKDFMNSAVLHSLPGAADDDGASELPSDAESGAVPAAALAEAISTICQRLPEPTGELAFDPALRVSARTRSPAPVPTSYISRRAGKAADMANDAGDGDGDGNDDSDAASLGTSSGSATPSGVKHWTVIKGAPEMLLPRCTRVWRGTTTRSSLSAKAIGSGDIDGVQELSSAFAQTLSRKATDIAVGGSRLIAYAIAITDEPLYCDAHVSVGHGSKGRPQAPSATAEAIKGSASALDALAAVPAYRFRDADSRQRGEATGAGAGAGAATLDVAKGRVLSVLPADLIFVGAFAFYDPPQREARPVVRECQDAGIRVIIATGDHPSTALAVASAVGIVECPSQPAHASPGAAALSGTYGAASEVHAITGEMVQRSFSLGTFAQLIDESNVFARVTPAQKLRLVHALQARGEVVAFIGDGINDAPALTRADVGICMGGNPSTADVAMDAASMIVLSGRFSGVVRALREGRRLAANVEKCMVFYLACKVALISLFAFLLIAEGASPLTPVQVIFIELFTDLGATWTFLTERAEGVACDADGLQPDASLTTLARTNAAVAGEDGADGPGVLGGGPAADWAVLFYACALLTTCLVPLLVPSLLLPSWAVVPVAPTLTFLTWMLAHSFLGMSMRTRLVPLRIHGRAAKATEDAATRAVSMAGRSVSSFAVSRGPHETSGRSIRDGQGRWFGRGRWTRVNVAGLIWVCSSVLLVVLASAIPPVGAHLGVVKLDPVEWAMVVLSPVLLFAVLETRKEIRFKRFARRLRHSATGPGEGVVGSVDEERLGLLRH
ncbi:hypothetical protein GGI07_001862 [Coemansia sp. Benny D115]|nr:hypothetical protein GGI07_001862 [Coemansia sp. Benny D115]